MAYVRYLLVSNCVRRIGRNGTPYTFLLTAMMAFGFFATAGALNIITRGQWEANPPKEPFSPLAHPVPYVIILHTATDSCISEKPCKNIVKSIQHVHAVTRGWSDIGYSFLIGGDGQIYEGRGWGYVGEFAEGYNVKAIGIAFIGNFMKQLPPKRALLAAKRLIAEGVKLGKISKGYVLLGHRQVSETESPGELLFRNIQTWGHWSPKFETPTVQTSGPSSPKFETTTVLTWGPSSPKFVTSTVKTWGHWSPKFQTPTEECTP